MPLIGKPLTKIRQTPKHKQDIVGFIVRSKPTKRVAYYETEEVTHLSSTEVLYRTGERRRQLLNKFPNTHFSIDTGIFRTQESFLKFFSRLSLSSSTLDVPTPLAPLQRGLDRVDPCIYSNIQMN